jgi:hypothetical protein
MNGLLGVANLWRPMWLHLVFGYVKHKNTLISPAEMSVLKSHLNHSAAWPPVKLGSMALRHQLSLVLPFSKVLLCFIAGYVPSL